MKRHLLFLLLIGSLYSCTNKQISSTSNQSPQSQNQQKASEDSLIGVVNKEINKVGIDDQSILILNGIEIEKEELELLNKFKLEDFTNVIAVSKDAATKIYVKKEVTAQLLSLHLQMNC